MDNLFLIVAISILIEALITYAHEIAKTPTLIATVVIGIVISFIFNATLFNNIGMDINIYADIVLTGIIASRGANYVYDIIGQLTNTKKAI